MRVHVLKHVPFEGPASIADWASERGHHLTSSVAVDGSLPVPGSVDLAVVMGGPMAADDEVSNPWLVAEKRWLADAIAAGRGAFGVCLGAQILAEVIGGKIHRNDVTEIGWFPVTLAKAAGSDPVFAAFPEGLIVGHWHGDTFSLPQGVTPVMSSQACANQAFTAYSGRVVGLQFHLEWTPVSLGALVEECVADLEGGGPWVQPVEKLVAGADAYGPTCRSALFQLLDRVERATFGGEGS